MFQRFCPHYKEALGTAPFCSCMLKERERGMRSQAYVDDKDAFVFNGNEESGDLIIFSS